jgi:hypothetical protein
MSNWKKEAKAASEAKLNRMGLNKKTAKTPTFDGVHAWDGLEGLDSGHAGKMPVKKSRFKRGGKVKHMAAEGGASNKHLGKAPRSKKAHGGVPPMEFYEKKKFSTPYVKGGGQGTANEYKDDNPRVYQQSGGIERTAMDRLKENVGLVPEQKKGGRIKKLSGGALARYREKAGEDLQNQKKSKDRMNLANMKSMMYGEPNRPYHPRDIMETEKRMSRRERGIRMAADKFSGKANVGPSEDEYARGGFAASNPAARKAMAAKIAYKKKGQTGFGNINYGMPKAKGGNVGHEDIAEDRKLIRQEVKESALKNRARKGGGGETPYNGPTHSFDLEMSGGGEKAIQTLGGQESDFEAALNKWLNLAKKAGWEGVNVKNMRTSYPGSSAGLMNKGGRAKKADGGSLRDQFNQAFRDARNSGEKTFEWNGKQYTTELYKPTTGPSFRGRGQTVPQYGQKQVNKMPDVDVMGNATGMKKGGRAHREDGGRLSKDEMEAKKLNISSRKNDMDSDFKARDWQNIPEVDSKWKQSGKAATKSVNKKMYPRGKYHPSEYGEMGENRAENPILKGLAVNRALEKQIDIGGSRTNRPSFKGWAKETKENLGYNAKGGRIQRKSGGRTKSKTNINIIMPQNGAPQAPQGGMPQGIPPELMAALAGGGGAPGMPPAGAAPAIPPMMPPPGGMPGMGPAGAGPGLGAMGAMGGGGPGMSPPMPPMRKAGGRIAKQGGGALGESGFGDRADQGGRPRGSQFHRGPAGVGDMPNQGASSPVRGGGMTKPVPVGGKGPTPYDPGQMNSFEPWLGGQPSPGGMGGYPIPMRPPGAEQPMPMGPGFPGGPPLFPPGFGGRYDTMPNPFIGQIGMQPSPFGGQPIYQGPGSLGQIGGQPFPAGMPPQVLGMQQGPFASTQGPQMGFQQQNATQQAQPIQQSQPMARKSGGRAMPKYRMKNEGSGSGYGRLQKADMPPANGTAPVERGRGGRNGPYGMSGVEHALYGTQGRKGDTPQYPKTDIARAEGSYAAKKGQKSSDNPYPKDHEFHEAWGSGYGIESGKKGK